MKTTIMQMPMNYLEIPEYEYKYGGYGSRTERKAENP